ncbi:peptidylprolyl isomerase [Luteimonas sp. SDU101]|uniref:peptidylprolyl isomerase n=1 Tax=unclassified Luteimonas TaxID=2629088 RepID=UPI003EBB456D
MRRLLARATLLAAACALPLSAAEPDAPARPRTTQQVLDASLPSDWRTPAPENTLYMELAAGRVVIELAPAFAPAHVANIRILAGEGFWNGTSIYRSHDNFVVQFGDADADDPAKAKPLGSAKTALPAEFERDAQGLPFHALPDPDGWAAQVGFAEGFPAAREGGDGRAWMAHCYGAVGAGRNIAPDSSLGAELYVVTGQSPRQLDRNITVVGRVIRGMELLSAIRRGPPPLGIYEDPAQRTPIVSITLASTLPESQRERIEVLRTDTPTFDALVESRRNRRDDFYHRPAGHIDLCNIAIPERTPAGG